MNDRFITCYTIFETQWGYFGLSAIENCLTKTHLPCSDDEAVKANLLKGLQCFKYEKPLFKPVQRQIVAYFAGQHIEFDAKIPVLLDQFSDFTKLTLAVCRKVTFGETVTYSCLAKMTGRAKAARAIGSALAKNPLPLIIPCHRIIRSDGEMGGFSALGGVKYKKKLISHEKSCL